ncbi:MAG: zinc ABC transporter substrate-binding protein [Chloroflexi bacterium]|nr:zinc ABC transporter substrate-binding protein [Chloroflexota bacterium]
MVADHHAWGYFADAYGFELIGTIIPGYSTLAEASAGDLAELEELIEQFDVRTIFIGNSINPGLATQIAKDTGIEIASLFTGSLSKANGPAPNYLEMMRHNMLLILEAFQ